MSKFLTSSSQKRAFEHAFIAKLGTKQPLLPQLLEYFINATIKSPKDFDHLAKAIKRQYLTPHAIIKALMFVHAYLQSGKNIAEDDMIAFINYLLFVCSNFNETTAAERSKDSNLSICGKNRINTDMSTREDESCDSKEALIFNMAKIYIRYLLKLVSIHDQYRRLGKMKNLQSHFVWMRINLLKNIANFPSSFTIIGRYFIRQYGNLAVSMIEILNKDIKKLNESIKGYIIHQNHMLSCVTNSASSMQIAQFMKMMDEINSLNETLIQIYLGKYFYDNLQHLQLPVWINTNSNEFDTIFRIAGKRKEQIRVKEQPFKAKTYKRIQYKTFE